MPGQVSTVTRILNLILRRRCSRAALARELRLSRPGISNPVERMLDAKLVIEDGCGKSSGGKPPILLRINPAAFATIGIDIGSSSRIRGVLCSGDGEAIALENCEQSNDFDTILASAANLVEKLRRSSSRPVDMVGLAVPGPVDRSKNEIISCNNFPLANRNLAAKLGSICGLPVKVENRAKAAAMWECYFGTGKDCDNFVFVSAGQGIGSAIYCGGRLFLGSSGQAGELSSLLLPDFKSERMLPVEQAMNEEYILKLANSTSPAEMLAKAQKSDPQAEATVKYIADNTGRLINLLSELFDPEMIILGGRFRDFDESFLARLGPCRAEPRLAAGGRGGAALGAALLVLDQKIAESSKVLGKS